LGGFVCKLERLWWAKGTFIPSAEWNYQSEEKDLNNNL